MRRVEKQVLIDKHCDKLEARLKQGESPNLVELLDEIPESVDGEFRSNLLSEFVELKLNYCSDDFTEVAAELSEQFPEKSDRIRRAVQRRSKSIETRTGDDSSRIEKIVGPNSTSALHTSSAGETVGRYKLIRQIGKGGMGTVWLERI